MVLGSISLVTIQEKKKVGRWPYWIQRQICTSKVEEQVYVEDTIKYTRNVNEQVLDEMEMYESG